LSRASPHPGGNVTGTANVAAEWVAKRLQSIAEVLPRIKCEQLEHALAAPPRRGLQ
jgi:hypothetical protein